MTNYKVLLSKTARKNLSQLEKHIQERVRKQLEHLEINPFEKRPQADIKKLLGSFDPVFYSLRIGKYRAVYAVNNKNVMIVFIIPREKGFSFL